MSAIEQLVDAGKEFVYASPAGFLAYYLHSIHHKLFHAFMRLVPRRLKGGTNGSH